MSGFSATFLIRTLTPVHVGCDLVHDPTSFVLDEDRAQLTPIEPMEFLGSLDPAELRHLRRICLAGSVQSLLGVYKFMRRQTFQGRRIPVSSQIVKHYRETLSIGTQEREKILEQLNNFVIRRTAFQASTERPYLPGSSVKGAIRTAYLSLLCHERPSRQRAGVQPSRLEKQLLGGSFSTDPFRLLKISDFVPVGDVPVKIRYAINRKKDGTSGDKGIYQILEMVEPGAVFQGTVQLDEPMAGAGIRRPLTMAGLERALSVFFNQHWRREQKELAHLTNRDPQDAHSGSLMRLGHHSGAECVTLEGLRSIRVRTGADKWEDRDSATTLWLASDSRKADPRHQEGLPLGWIQLRRASLAEKEKAEETEAKWREQESVWRQRRLERLQQLQRQAEARQAALQRQQQEALQRREEERRREQEWAELTPFQKDLRTAQEGKAGSEVLSKIVSRIEDYPQSEQVQLAKALKAVYLSKGTWEVKKKKKKQFDRVASLKRILGEN